MFEGWLHPYLCLGCQRGADRAAVPMQRALFESVDCFLPSCRTDCLQLVTLRFLRFCKHCQCSAACSDLMQLSLVFARTTQCQLVLPVSRM